MKKKIWTGAALLICLMLLLSGCSYQILTPDQLMRPPRYYGENAGLQEAFAEAAPNAMLKAPYEGDYHSAFILTDLDSDGVEEALAFYVNNMDKNICRMMLLNGYKAAGRFAPPFAGRGAMSYPSPLGIWMQTAYRKSLSGGEFPAVRNAYSRYIDIIRSLETSAAWRVNPTA